MLTQMQLNEFLQTLGEPQYGDPEHKGPILLYGKIGNQKIAFWASPFDAMDYGREIYQKALDGYYGNIAEGDYTNVVVEINQQKDLF